MAENDGIGLSEINNFPQDIADGLRRLGIMDAQHFVAVLNVPGTGLHLAQALEISQERLNAAAELAVSVVPLAEAQAVGEIPEMYLGVLDITPEIQVQIQSTQTAPPAAPAALPPHVNHIPMMQPIRNQASRGTCVAFTVTAIREFLARKQNAPQDFSEQFLYHETKLIDGYPSACGTWQVKAIGVVQGLGVCRETVWPYNGNLPCNNNGTEPGTAKPDAAGFRATPVIYGANNLNSAKTALASDMVLGISIPVYASWYNSSAVRLSGDINMRVGGEASVGGHALCVVGYKDDASFPGGGHLILRNSWSTNWAPNNRYGAGYGTLPYAYLTQDAMELVSLR